MGEGVAILDVEATKEITTESTLVGEKEPAMQCGEHSR